jgi:hypothetical protein
VFVVTNSLRLRRFRGRTPTALVPRPAGTRGRHAAVRTR